MMATYFENIKNKILYTQFVENKQLKFIEMYELNSINKIKQLIHSNFQVL